MLVLEHDLRAAMALVALLLTLQAVQAHNQSMLVLSHLLVPMLKVPVDLIDSQLLVLTLSHLVGLAANLLLN